MTPSVYQKFDFGSRMTERLWKSLLIISVFKVDVTVRLGAFVFRRHLILPLQCI